MDLQAERWLARVHHDLVKRLLWAARDRRDLGGPVRTGELVTLLVDDEGCPTHAREHFHYLCKDAPACLLPPVMAWFGQVLDEVEQAAQENNLLKVLVLEEAFHTLALTMKEGTAHAPTLGHR